MNGTKENEQKTPKPLGLRMTWTGEGWRDERGDVWDVLPGENPGDALKRIRVELWDPE